jgi:hypothetical protein
VESAEGEDENAKLDRGKSENKERRLTSIVKVATMTEAGKSRKVHTRTYQTV